MTIVLLNGILKMESFLRELFENRINKNDFYDYLRIVLIVSVIAAVFIAVGSSLDLFGFMGLLPHGIQTFYSFVEYGAQLSALLIASLMIYRKNGVFSTFRFFFYYFCLAAFEHFWVWYIIEPGCLTCSDSDGYEVLLGIPVVFIIVLVLFIISFTLYKISKDRILVELAREYLLFCTALSIAVTGAITGYFSYLIFSEFLLLIVVVALAVPAIIGLLKIAEKSRINSTGNK